MRLPKYDILLPTLFVGVIFPAAAGGWWRFLSGYADAPLRNESAIVEQVSAPQAVVMASHVSAPPVHRRRTVQAKPVAPLAMQEPSFDEPYVYMSDESLN